MMNNETYNLTTTRYALSGAILGISMFSIISNLASINVSPDVIDVIGGIFGFISVFVAKARHLF